MTNEIIPYRPGSVDNARRSGQVSDNAGGTGGGRQGESRESAEVMRLREQISEITKLAHTGRSRDEAQYQRLQPELRGLMEQLVAARSGRSVATTGDGAPDKASAYPNLPADSSWREAWADSKDRLQAAGITVEQSRVLGQAVLAAEQEAQERAAAAVQQRRADTRRALAKLFGGGWEREVEQGNRRACELLPDGAAKQLFNEQLADGSVLGDHEMICRLMIELARGRR